MGFIRVKRVSNTGGHPYDEDYRFESGRRPYGNFSGSYIVPVQFPFTSGFRRVPLSKSTTLSPEE